jgi:hypothetical protein
MAGPIFTNNAVGVLAASYSAAATAITLVGGQGNRFPAPAANEWFPLTVVDALNNIEIMRCTGRTSDTFTVVRGQEGTPSRALAAGEKVEHRLTAAALIGIRDQPADPAQIPDNALLTRMINDLAITPSKIADGAVGTSKIAPGSITPALLAVGVAVANLGFTPVQQSTGVGQNASIVKLGWTNVAKLGVTIDTTDLGFILTERNNGDPANGGYRGVPNNGQNNDYTLGLIDTGRAVVHSSGNHVYYLPDHGAVPFGDGCIIKINNRGGQVTLAPAPGMTLTWVPTGATGNRLLAAPGSVIVEKMDAANWWVYGAGLT